MLQTSVVNTHAPFHCDGLFIRMNKSPFIIGKLIKIKKNAAAEIFYSKYFDKDKIAQVEGYNIFIVYHGTTAKPHNPSFLASPFLRQMCEWYYKEKVDNNRTVKRLFKSI